MSTVVLEGLALTLLAGALAGNCMLPMKFARRWQWENVWLVFSIVSLLILPWALALTLAGNLGEIYGGLDYWQLVLPVIESSVDLPKIAGQRQSKRPWQNQQRDHAENQPDILPLPAPGELHRQHAVARERPCQQGQRETFQHDR